MRCPIDNETLVMADRNGVEIDYCPKCRGVWLDRGELDKIIDRATAGTAQPPREAPRDAPREAQRHREEDDHRSHKPYRKKESFLSDLFDF